MKELLEACQKFIAQISPSGDERYYDIDPQDLKEFCDVVEAAQPSVQADKCHACNGKGKIQSYYAGEVICLTCGGRGSCR